MTMINFRDTSFLNIDDCWDCESIKNKLRGFEMSRDYPIDYGDDLAAVVEILQKRKKNLGCE